jgi:hypothetical protein
MKPFCEIVPTLDWHVSHVAANARLADVDELAAGWGCTPQQGLARCVRGAARAWTGLVDGVPVCVFGVSPWSLVTGEGAPWMVATDGLHRVERPFLRLSRPVVDAMQRTCPRLTNWVDNRNVRAQRWLTWLGFTLEDPAPFGPAGLPFRRFTRN